MPIVNIFAARLFHLQQISNSITLRLKYIPHVSFLFLPLSLSLYHSTANRLFMYMQTGFKLFYLLITLFSFFVHNFWHTSCHLIRTYVSFLFFFFFERKKERMQMEYCVKLFVILFLKSLNVIFAQMLKLNIIWRKKIFKFRFCT